MAMVHAFHQELGLLALVLLAGMGLPAVIVLPDTMALLAKVNLIPTLIPPPKILFKYMILTSYF